MTFTPKNHLIGLDIGSNTLKICDVASNRKKGYVLNKFGLINIPCGVIEDGVIKDPETVAEAIRELFAAQKVKEKNVAVSIGGYSVIVKKIQVPSMTDYATGRVSVAELQNAIFLEAEQYIPFDIADVNLDYQVLGESASVANKLDVVLVAAKKELVEEYVNLMNLAGLNLCIIDVDAFALQNVYEVSRDGSEGVVALIDMGASKTSLNVLNGNSSLFMRDMALGCNQINQKISAKASCSLQDAEAIKRGGKSAKMTPQDVQQIIDSVIKDWCLEIRRAIDFFYSTFQDDQIKKILVSGGGANIGEFRQSLAMESGVAVEAFNPFAAFLVGDRIDASLLDRASSQAAICMGLSIRRTDDK